MCRIRSYSKSVSEVLRWGNQTHCLTSERCKICNPKSFILQIWCWHTKRMTKHSIIMWWVQMEKGGVCWKSLAAPCWLNEKPSDQAIQRLHVSKPCQKERKLLQSAKLLHEKQLRTHLATQNLEFFRKNPWRCPANSARKHFADLTSTSEIWFHLWNFRYSFQEMPKVETDGFHDPKNRETQHLWAKNSSANDGKFPEVEKYRFVTYDWIKKTSSCQSLFKIIPRFLIIFQMFCSPPSLLFALSVCKASSMSFTLLSGIDEGLGTAGVSPAPSTERISSSESTTLSWNFSQKFGCENLKIFLNWDLAVPEFLFFF